MGEAGSACPDPVSASVPLQPWKGRPAWLRATSPEVWTLRPEKHDESQTGEKNCLEQVTLKPQGSRCPEGGVEGRAPTARSAQRARGQCGCTARAPGAPRPPNLTSRRNQATGQV